MKFFSAPALLLFLALGSAAVAAPLTRDLGEGLAYHRVTALPADLPTEESARKQPCVLDLRYATGDEVAGTALQAWLKFHAATRTPVFLLINADTSAPVLATLAKRLPAAGVVVIGTASPALTPDIELKVAPETERRAYDALVTGLAIESLLNDTPEKARNDEARLAQDHTNQGSFTPSPAPGVEEELSLRPSADPAAAVEKAPPVKAPPPLIDTALQRAVQLHRSLKALKKV